MNSQQTDLVDH
ncbi:hypothetical protein C5167_029296 [Papaver somniferum]|nr:hypothetical protein C5167_029296 [Papaver somniferum]